MKTYKAEVIRDEETGLLVGIVHEVPSAYTQAATLEELKANLEEVLSLCLEEAENDSAFEIIV